MRRLFLGVSIASIVIVGFALAVLIQGCGEDSAATETTVESVEPTSEPSPTTPASPTATPGTSLPTGSASGPAEHDGERALALVKELAKEPRVSGTAAEVRAAEYISSLFRSYGYTTEIMEFEFDGDRFRAGEVRVDGKTIEALTLAGSPGGLASARTAYVGLADAAGIGNQDLTGRIAVADRGTLNFVDKYQNVKVKGAVGLVIVNHQPGPFSGNLTTLAEFPVVAVAKEDGAAILNAAKAEQRIDIEAPPTTGKTKALNVIARASETATCEIVVGGHFDSVPGAPGANDNASGTANVIEVARALAADGLDKGLCFSTFGAEESGLYGSKALVARMESEGKLPRYMLNLDVTGIGKGVEVIGDGQISRDAIRLAKELGYPAVASSLPANSGSDHQSFEDAGVETVFLTSGDFATIHSPRDVSADIDVNVLDQIGDTAVAVVKQLLAEVARG